MWLRDPKIDILASKNCTFGYSVAVIVHTNAKQCINLQTYPDIVSANMYWSPMQ